MLFFYLSMESVCVTITNKKISRNDDDVNVRLKENDTIENNNCTVGRTYCFLHRDKIVANGEKAFTNSPIFQAY